MLKLRILFKCVLSTLLAAFLCCCRPKYSPDPYYETSNDFENSFGWIDLGCNNAKSISKAFGKNSSGCVHISRKCYYGYSFSAKLGELSKYPISTVYVAADCKKNSKLIDSCGLVCSVTNSDGKIISWQEKQIKEYSNESDWFKLDNSFSINGLYGSENTIHIFFWNHE